MHPFAPQPTPINGVCVDGELRAMHRPEMGSRHGGDTCYASTSGTSAELARGAASESRPLVAPVNGSGATLDMQMVRGWDRELASLYPSPLMLDLTVVAASAGPPLHRAAIRYNSYISW